MDLGKAAYDLASRKDMNIKDSELRENPYNTKTGQDVVSMQENSWMRLFREGRPKNINNEAFDATVSTNWTYSLVLAPSPGMVLYPKRTVVSASVDMEINVRISTGIGQAPNVFHVVYLKSGTPYILEFEGDICCFEGGNIQIGYRTTTVGKVWASIYGVEVVSNA